MKPPFLMFGKRIYCAGFLELMNSVRPFIEPLFFVVHSFWS